MDCSVLPLLDFTRKSFIRPGDFTLDGGFHVFLASKHALVLSVIQTDSFLHVLAAVTLANSSVFFGISEGMHPHFLRRHVNGWVVCGQSVVEWGRNGRLHEALQLEVVDH